MALLQKQNPRAAESLAYKHPKIRAGDTTRRDLAIASGVQILSTDYPFNWKAKGSGYRVTLGRQKVRCNPVNAPKACVIKATY